MTTYNQQIEDFVDGSGINKLAPAFKNVNTLGELQALNIYSHLSGGEKTTAENDLLARVMTFNGEDELPDMSINHVNGVQNIYAGTSVAVSSGIGSGLDGNKTLVLTPSNSNWKTHDVIAKAKTLLVQTNIKANDLPAHDIIVFLSTAWKNGSNSSTSGERVQVTFGAASGDGDGVHGVIASGPAYAGNIGDLGTFYAQIDIPDPTTEDSNIGSGNPIDTNYYYIIGFQINSASITKLFKFRIQVQYD
jgi:hypothetical protein